MTSKTELIERFPDAPEKGLHHALLKAMNSIEAPLPGEDADVSMENPGFPTTTGATARDLAAMMDLVPALAADREVKDALATYAAQHFEIICHLVLRGAAARLGMTGVVSLFDAILSEEQGVSAGLQRKVSQAVRSFVENP